jgi:hypothetical protein
MRNASTQSFGPFQALKSDSNGTKMLSIELLSLELNAVIAKMDGPREIPHRRGQLHET